MKAILGRKAGMTQVFTTDGVMVPVTVIEVLPNVVLQKKTVENDGYEAIQLGFDTVREKLSNKAKIGHAKKANTAPKRFLREIRGVNVNDYTLGKTIGVDIFEAGEIVDVTGTSKGHGYAGTIKRWGTHRGPMTHGSHYHRGPGSLGACSDPSRVFKGKKLPGHYGVDKVTIQNLDLVKVDKERNLLLVKGSVPGPRGGLLVVKNAVKANA